MSYITNELPIYEIKKWIKDLFQDSEVDIPDFEGNYECMKFISNIISANIKAEKDVEEILKTESCLADYYTKKGDDIMNKFSETMTLKDLQLDIAESVEKIASVATQMKLREPTITNFLLSSAALDNKKESHIEQEMMNAFTLSKFSKKITDTMQKNVILERDIEILEKKVVQQQAMNSDILEQSKFFRIKGEEYKNRTKKMQKQLKTLEWRHSLSHPELVKRSEVLQDLESNVNNISAKLESYQNLPPNETLTKFKIEEAEAELLRLQNEFSDLLKVSC